MATVDDATWTPVPELLKHLEKVITLQSVSLQPPVGYVQTKHPKSDVYEAAGLKVYLWQKKSTDRVSPSLTVTILPATLKEAWEADKFINGFAESMSREWQHSPTSEFVREQRAATGIR